MTGRPPIGDTARNKSGSLRISVRERKYLRRKYGTVAAGLRVALDELLPDSVQAPSRAVNPEKVINTQELLFTDGPCKHPGWTVVARGSKTKTIVKKCRACGERRTEME